MQSFLALPLAALSLLIASPNMKKDTVKKATDWVSLFDGKTFKGWHTYGKKTVNPSWKIENGAIFFNGAKKSAEEKSNLSADLVSDKEYENFHIKYDWKISSKGNSGFLFWVQEDPAKYTDTYFTGPEMQVLDNDGHADGKIPKHRAGNLYDLVAGQEGAVKPVGEWNTAEIIADHGKLEFLLNGVSLLTTRYDNDNWRRMIAGSKFKQWPDFGKVFKGHFALQDHGNDVWFRNIMIKKL